MTSRRIQTIEKINSAQSELNRAEKACEHAERQCKLRKEDFHKAKIRKKAGVGTITDLLRAIIAYDKAEKELHEELKKKAQASNECTNAINAINVAS